MQALFALKKIVSTFAGGRPSFCRPHFFICANCGGRRLDLNGKKIAGNPPIKNILEF